MNEKNGMAGTGARDVSLTYTDELTNCKLHGHDFYEFAVTVKDGFYHTVNGADVFPAVGDVLLLRPGDSHSLTVKNGSADHVCLNIMFPVTVFDDVCASLSKTLPSQIRSVTQPIMFRIPARAVEAFSERFSNPLFKVGESMVSGDRLSLYRQIRQCLAFEIAGYLIMAEPFNDVVFSPCVSAVIAFLEDEARLCMSVSEIAANIGYSPSYLSRRFRKQFNLTLERYLISQRLAKAKIMLADTALSVEAVGMRFGWSKTGSFIRAFKNAYGVSPGKFRSDTRREEKEADVRRSE